MSKHIPAETVILLAEDEVVIRNLVRTMLTREGYAVIEASNGREAFEICQKYQDPIGLLITNVRMPEMDGIELAERVRRMRPEVKIVVMSGEMDNAIIGGNRPDAFLRKPFVPPTLLKAIQKVLDGEELRTGDRVVALFRARCFGLCFRFDASHLTNERNFLGPIGGSVGVKDFVEPDCGFTIRVGMLP